MSLRRRPSAALPRERLFSLLSGARSHGGGAPADGGRRPSPTGPRPFPPPVAGVPPRRADATRRDRAIATGLRRNPWVFPGVFPGISSLSATSDNVSYVRLRPLFSRGFTRFPPPSRPATRDFHPASARAPQTGRQPPMHRPTTRRVRPEREFRTTPIQNTPRGHSPLLRRLARHALPTAHPGRPSTAATRRGSRSASPLGAIQNTAMQ